MTERCEYVHEFNTRLSETESRSKSNTHRLDTLEQWQRDQTKLIQSVAVMAEKQTEIERDVGEIRNDLRTVLERPGKRWDDVVGKIISALVGGVITWLLVQVGIGG